MGLQGSLQDFDLASVMQLVALRKHTGRLDVESRGKEGYIFFVDGRVAHGDYGGLGGEEAVLSICAWIEGSFIFQAGLTAGEQSVTMSNERIIMEALRRADELSEVRQHIPSVDAVFRLSMEPPPGVEEIVLTPEEWRALVFIDGTRDVETIAMQSGLGEYRVLKVLGRLLAVGLIATERREPLAHVSQLTGLPVAPAGTPAPPRPAPEEERRTNPPATFRNVLKSVGGRFRQRGEVFLEEMLPAATTGRLGWFINSLLEEYSSGGMYGRGFDAVQFLEQLEDRVLPGGVPLADLVRDGRISIEALVRLQIPAVEALPWFAELAADIYRQAAESISPGLAIYGYNHRLEIGLGGEQDAPLREVLSRVLPHGR